MKIKPIAFDSFGARSMCTMIETKDLTITIDPSVALGPKRYGLPPHPIEIQRMAELWDKIKEAVRMSDLIIITHYHYDHHNPNEPEIFDGKRVLLKHPEEMINRSQRNRARYFLSELRKFNVDYEFADGKSFEFGDVEIKISNPVFHGVDEKLGYVIQVLISESENFVFSSDVEGPIHRDQAKFLIENDPDVCIIDGPMTYMLGYRFSNRSFESSISNLKEIVEKTGVKHLVIDHHLTRDINYRSRMSEVYAFAESAGAKAETAREFTGFENDLLEARRKELYREH
ncbi:putative hydrolase of the metallo-beta-lactamase superfamily [Archaeoglobus sulfaticallidus PM70-1]|uniref:UPF0282 protein Asulf_01597 n=1 Tax=Archaeoglobus sulfaticallidus PM70-1 TaxID=387631 RepID=N0BEY9_9EURY|nr:MBL fold metallo-hydrolase [Archaeoglobus sulfaticallidus]AGK61573.1 putative hydrolase of the metallo-beta-lactamase superfamily [Archaeoglobus sulfaticallidus PM70-1]